MPIAVAAVQAMTPRARKLWCDLQTRNLMDAVVATMTMDADDYLHVRWSDLCAAHPAIDRQVAACDAEDLADFFDVLLGWLCTRDDDDDVLALV